MRADIFLTKNTNGAIMPFGFLYVQVRLFSFSSKWFATQSAAAIAPGARLNPPDLTI
jgi:hypothetical protein